MSERISDQVTFTFGDFRRFCIDFQLEHGHDPAQVNRLYLAFQAYLLAQATARQAMASQQTQMALHPAPRPAHRAPKAVQRAMFSTVQADVPLPLSAYQRAILDHLMHTTSGDVLIDAVAGSGKTSTVVALAPALQGDALFLAFNHHIVKTLQTKLGSQPGVTVATVHRIGNGLLSQALQGKTEPREYKYEQLCRHYVQAADPAAERQAVARASGALAEWARYVRLTLTDPRDADAVCAMVAQYGLEDADDLVPDLLAWLPVILDQGEQVARDQRLIDFTDMLYLPYRWQLMPRQAAWVLVDECQDLSAAALHLALACRAPGGWMIFVGDAHQAINGFAGADVASIQRIEEQTRAQRFPLPISYRCPSSHLDLARAIVPQIEARPGAPVGIVEHIQEDQLALVLRPGDLVLCRLTAPLLEQCFALLHAGVKVTVRGRDIGKGLTAIVQAVARIEGFTFGKFGECLGRYELSQIERMVQRPQSEGRIESLRDRCEAIRTCYERFPAQGVADLCTQIEDLFDNKEAKVTLSTVHRAKGSEAARVFLLKPKKMPLTWPEQQPWEYQQEQHIRYVALTRATEVLFFVED